MTAARGIRAGRAYVELGVDDKIAQGLRKAERRLRAFGEGLRSLGTRVFAAGAGTLTPLLGAVRTFSESGDALAKMSQRTGVSVEALSELGFAAEQSGTNLEILELGLRNMQKSIVAAASGSDGAAEALARLRLTVADLANLSPERQFKLIADRLSQIANPTLRAALALELFGKRGTQLLPLLNDGARGIEMLQEEARALGLTLSTDAAKKSVALHDTLNILWRVVKRLTIEIGASLSDAVSDLASRVIRVVMTSTAGVKQNQAIIVSAAKVAIGVTAAGAALVMVGTLISSLGTIFGVLASVVSGVGAAFGALLSPIGLVMAAVVGLGTMIAVYTDAGVDALAWLSKQFGMLKDIVLTTVGGMADALAAGDIILASQVLWAGLKLVWEQGTHALLQIWLTLKGKFLGIINDFVYGGQAMWVEFVADVQSLWANLVGFLRSTWAKFSTWHARAVEHSANWIAKRWLELQGVWDRSLDVEAAKAEVDRQSKQRFDEIADKERADLEEIEKKKNEALVEAVKRRDERLASIGAAETENERRQRAEREQRLRDSEAELNKAKADLDAARAAAAQKRKEVEPAAARALRRPAVDPLADLDDRISGLADLMAGKLSIMGTFNPMAVAGLGAASAEERTAQNTEQIAKHTKRLVDAATVGRLSFA